MRTTFTLCPTREAPALWRSACLAILLVVACGDDDRGTVDGGPLADAAIAADGGSIGDAGPPRDAGPRVDAGSVDAGSVDAGSSGVDGGPPAADIDLSFGGGCAPDFSGDVVVVRNASSIAVSATRAGALTGSVQLDLMDAPGTLELSSRHRVDSGSVVNVITTTTWTNLAMDSAGVLGGTVADPIGGSLQVDTYDEAAGRLDVRFVGVTLQNPSDGSLCTVDGRLETSRLSF